MTNIVKLTPNNFTMMGTASKTLGITSPASMLIFFRMQCENCAAFDPVFRELAKKDTRVQYGILDIDVHTQVGQWSLQTSTPIKAVPFLVLYVNGRPHAKFGGTKNVASISSFLTKALNTQPTAPAQQFVAQTAPASRGGGAGGGGGGAGNMYGGGGGGNPRQGPTRKQYTPELGEAPSMKGIIKGYTGGGGVVEDEEDKMAMVPPNVIPYNQPWAEPENY